jgi:hypothetical protein
VAGRFRAPPGDHLDKTAGEQLSDLVEAEIAPAIGRGLCQFAQHHQFWQRRGGADLPDIGLVADCFHQFRAQKKRQALIAADVIVATDIFIAGMADQDRSGYQLEEAAAAAAAETALAHKGDRAGAMPFHVRRVARPGAAAEVGHRNGLALQQGRDVHGGILDLRARRSNGKQHVEQGLAGHAARALDRQQAALGNGATIGGNLVRIAAGFEHPMARHDNHERVAGNRLRDRMRSTRSPELGCDFAIGAGFAAGYRARELVNPQIEGGYLAGIERDVGEIARLAAQRRDNALDRSLDIERRAEFTGVWKLAQQPASGFDLACFRQLHANDAEMAPCDTASADPRIEYRVPTP